MLPHPMTGPVTVSPHSGVDMVEEAGCGSIVGACALHPRQSSTLLRRIHTNLMTTTTKTRCQYTLWNHSTQRVCSFVQDSFPHRRVKLKCKGEQMEEPSHGASHSSTSAPSSRQPDQVEYEPNQRPTTCFQDSEGQRDLLTTSKPSEKNPIGFLKRHQTRCC